MSLKTCLFPLFLALLCVLPTAHSAEAATTPPPQDPPQDSLRILSWNIHMLPYFVYYRTKKRIRAKLIVEEMLARDYHIIVFQEAFHRRVRNKMGRRLKERFPYQYGPANRQWGKLKTNSGIWIVSDRPLKELATVQFDTVTTPDNKMARKGAMLLEGEFGGRAFQIIGTHTQGNPIWVNNSQFRKIRLGLLDPYRKEGVPQIICGDMNCSMSVPAEYQPMLRLFDVPNPAPMYDARHDNKDQLVTQTIDYIFVRDNNSDMRVHRKNLLIIGPDWEQGSKKIYGKTVGLSDHPSIDISVGW